MIYLSVLLNARKYSVFFLIIYIISGISLPQAVRIDKKQQRPNIVRALSGTYKMQTSLLRSLEQAFLLLLGE